MTDPRITIAQHLTAIVEMSERLEERTGWLFGMYRAIHASDPTWPLFAIGRTVASSGPEAYPSGFYVTLGARGVYLCREDALERGRARQIQRLENYANEETK